jgi:hypothetical protein
MPTPSLVMIALVCAGTLNSSAAYLSTAVNGAASGTLNTRYGSLGSDVSVILNVTLDLFSWLFRGWWWLHGLRCVCVYKKGGALVAAACAACCATAHSVNALPVLPPLLPSDHQHTDVFKHNEHVLFSHCPRTFCFGWLLRLVAAAAFAATHTKTTRKDRSTFIIKRNVFDFNYIYE